jgi:tripartite-type tricarboxylate transporter receptor subunit TctC
MSRSSALAIVAASLAFSTVASAVAADPADFYRGRTVEILVGFSPGGGYDIYPRSHCV